MEKKKLESALIDVLENMDDEAVYRLAKQIDCAEVEDIGLMQEDFEDQYCGEPLLNLISRLSGGFDTDETFYSDCGYKIESSDSLGDFASYETIVGVLMERLPSESIFNEWGEIKQAYDENVNATPHTEEEIREKLKEKLHSLERDRLLILYQDVISEKIWCMGDLAYYLSEYTLDHITYLFTGWMDHTMDFKNPFFIEMERQLMSMGEPEVIEAITTSPNLFKKDLSWCSEITDIMRGNW